MSKKIKALFLTKYSREGASSRYRFLQYFPHLESEGIECTYSPLTDATYLEHLYQKGRGTAVDLAGSLMRRLGALWSIPEYDVIVVEYEIMPYFPPIFENIIRRMKKPCIVNYDDAIFYRYRQHPNSAVRHFLGKKIDMVMRSARLVIAGNKFLADYASKAGASWVEILPTVVDIDRYPDRLSDRNDTFTIGWIGSPSTAKYIREIAPALSELCRDGRSKLLMIGSGQIKMNGVPVEVRTWSEASEITDLESCDVGIMPLHDGLWEKGKCGLKLVQYMACGLPVVVSPVGVNKALVEDNVNGFLAKDKNEWVNALKRLRDDMNLRHKMGQAGRKKIEAEFSIQATAPKMAGLIKDAVGSRRKKA